jgi:glycerate kinase
LICSDRWGELAASEVTSAIATGWQERQPAAEVVSLPFSSGGFGFVAALASALGANTPLPQPDWLFRDADTHYLDGSLLTSGSDSQPLGMALADSVTAGARRIVVGVGDAAMVDGGAGLLHALGDSDDLTIALPRALQRTKGVEVVAAYKEDIMLLGLKGASASAVETLGWSKQDAQDSEQRIGDFADAVRRVAPPRRDLLSGKVHRHDHDAGSGAGGGVGYALAILGARLVPGADCFAEIVGLAGRVIESDLVVVGTGTFDWRSLADDTVATVVRAATAVPTPAILLAREVEVGRRETMSLGASAAYPLVDPRSLRQQDNLDDRAGLVALARRVAGTWSAT